MTSETGFQNGLVGGAEVSQFLTLSAVKKW